MRRKNGVFDVNRVLCVCMRKKQRERKGEREPRVFVVYPINNIKTKQNKNKNPPPQKKKKKEEDGTSII